jgi:hypothetical protein
LAVLHTPLILMFLFLHMLIALYCTLRNDFSCILLQIYHIKKYFSWKLQMINEMSFLWHGYQFIVQWTGFYKISKILFEFHVMLDCMNHIFSEPFNIESEWNPFTSWRDETSKQPYSPLCAFTHTLSKKNMYNVK